MVFDHRGEHTSKRARGVSVSGKTGCPAQTHHNWVAQVERDAGKRPGPGTKERERIGMLERDAKEPSQANEFLRKASAYFAQDRRQGGIASRDA